MNVNNICSENYFGTDNQMTILFIFSLIHILVPERETGNLLLGRVIVHVH
jgi:hypothetical protein